MSENSATRTLRQHLIKAGAHVQRFEDSLSPGIPDMMACLNGKTMFLEGKHVKLPARDTTRVRFGAKGEPRLAFQRNWLEAHRRAGGLCFFWVRCEAGWFVLDKFEWLTEGVEKRTLLQERAFPNAKEVVKYLEDL